MTEFVFLVRYLSLAAAALLVGVCVVLAWKYWRAWMKTNKMFDVNPLYVGMFMLSYSLLMAYTVIDVFFLVESGPPHFTWRAAFVIPALVAGLVSVWKIMRYTERNA